MLYCYRATLTITKFGYAHPIQQLQVKKRTERPASQRQHHTTAALLALCWRPPAQIATQPMHFNQNKEPNHQGTTCQASKNRGQSGKLLECNTTDRRKKKGVKAGILYAARML